MIIKIEILLKVHYFRLLLFVYLIILLGNIRMAVCAGSIWGAKIKSLQWMLEMVTQFHQYVSSQVCVFFFFTGSSYLIGVVWLNKIFSVYLLRFITSMYSQMRTIRWWTEQYRGLVCWDFFWAKTSWSMRISFHSWETTGVSVLVLIASYPDFVTWSLCYFFC